MIGKLRGGDGGEVRKLIFGWGGVTLGIPCRNGQE
uniref:Uncharacterized protein n=1 Tax=Pyricularia oryzae (strain P131) TaxID=1143193 RepID=L7JNU7_PYRO1